LLIVWKYPRGIYQVDTRDPDPTQWSVYRLTLAWGAINSATQANIGNDVFFLDPQGEFQLLSAAQELGETRGQSLSSALQLQEWIRSHVNLNAIRRSRMAYYARRQQVHVGVCTPETDLNDLRLVWDFSRPDRPRMTESPRDGCTALWVARDPIEQRLAAGDAFGFVWILDWPGTTRDGLGYDGRLQTMWSDLGAGTRRKNAQFLTLEFAPVGNWQVDVKVWWDGQIVNTIPVQLTSPVGLYLGSWILGTNVLGASNTISRKRIRLTGGGHRMSLEVGNAQPNQDFALAHAYLEFTLSDERV